MRLLRPKIREPIVGPESYHIMVSTDNYTRAYLHIVYGDYASEISAFERSNFPFYFWVASCSSLSWIDTPLIYAKSSLSQLERGVCNSVCFCISYITEPCSLSDIQII